MKVWNPDGDFLIVRSLIDSGAQRSIASSHLVGRLGLPWTPHGGLMRGIGNFEAPVSRGEVELMFGPLEGDLRVLVRTSVLDNILGDLPQERIWDSVVSLTMGLTPADPNWQVPGPIDLLLGSDVLGLIVSGVVRPLQRDGIVRG